MSPDQRILYFVSLFFLFALTIRRQRGAKLQQQQTNKKSGKWSKVVTSAKFMMYARKVKGE